MEIYWADEDFAVSPQLNESLTSPKFLVIMDVLFSIFSSFFNSFAATRGHAASSD
jgi:hypothetical protein